jgi:23S rRNA (cytosine1962-C5)-methyltransferase
LVTTFGALANVPPPGDRRIAVRVKSKALWHLRRGHPWLFDQSIVSESFRGEAGDLAVVFDDKREFVAIGLLDPTSPMRVRILHRGKSRPIDGRFWSEQLAAASVLRQELDESHETTGYRVLNGENDGWPGLILDRYANTLALKLYSAAWIPHLATILEPIVERFGPEGVVLRLARNVASGETFGLTDGQRLYGQSTEPVLFRENGLTFESHVLTGQKTGHFLDQRDNRQRVGEMASGKSVLDVFACTGGFSVYAAAGGARFVQSVDLNGAAIETAQRNFAHNVEVTSKTRHKVTVGDAFEVMESLRNANEHFDIVVIDPPSFAKRQSDVGRGIRAYARLTSLALPLLKRGGRLVQASCSSRISAEDFAEAVTGQARRDGINLVEIGETGHAIDHPIGFSEGGYLKAIFAKVE